MCSSCGYPAAAGHWSEAGAGDAGERLRSRFRRAQVLNGVLRSYGLTAHDGGLIPGIQIASLSGGQVIAENLTDVWAAVQQLAGAPVDPLDERFLDSMDEAR